MPRKPKGRFHFNRIVPKRSVFLCFLSDSVELMTLTQKKMLRYTYVTIRLKWKTGLIRSMQYLIACCINESPSAVIKLTMHENENKSDSG